MTKTMLAAGIAVVVLPAAAVAGPFDGTWKGNVASVKMSQKLDVFLLKDGVYACPTCEPAVRVAADGADHAVKASPYFDSVAITVVDPTTIKEIDKKAGKITFRATSTVSADGKTLTIALVNSAYGAPVSFKGSETRIKPAPAGAHAVSGSWRAIDVSDISADGLIETIKTDGRSFAMTTPLGQSYTATLGGAEAPFTGDPGITSVAVAPHGARTVVETDRRDGKIVGITRMTVSADGRMMMVTNTDTVAGRTASWTANKQ